MSQTRITSSNIFTEHPHSVGETYGEHFLFALRFAGLLFGASAAALVHALLPFCFEKTASQLIRGMVAEMDARVK